DLILKINGTTDQVRVLNHYLSSGYSSFSISAVQFTDGTQWSGAALPNTLLGDSGNNNLFYGTSGNDIFDGGAGNDSMNGYGGNDLYRFGRGYGQDVIYDYSTDYSQDTLVFQADVRPLDLSVTRVDTDLVLAIQGT